MECLKLQERAFIELCDYLIDGFCVKFVDFPPEFTQPSVNFSELLVFSFKFTLFINSLEDNEQQLCIFVPDDAQILLRLNNG